MEIEPETYKFNVLNVFQRFSKNGDNLLSLLKIGLWKVKILKFVQLPMHPPTDWWEIGHKTPRKSTYLDQ